MTVSPATVAVDTDAALLAALDRCVTTWTVCIAIGDADMIVREGFADRKAALWEAVVLTMDTVLFAEGGYVLGTGLSRMHAGHSDTVTACDVTVSLFRSVDI